MRPTPNLDWFAFSFKKLCYRLEPPIRTIVEGQPTYRFKEKSIQAAILLKTARYVSGLQASKLLLCQGFLQELGTLQRSVDDFGQDATFLALACISGTIEPIHIQFLTSFWEEMPSFENFLTSQRNKDDPPRSKIQSYISRAVNGSSPGFRENAASKFLSRMYSGYTHGAAPNAMDMYNPATHAIEVSGSTSNQLIEAHESDFENQLFRGVLVIATAARALGDAALTEEAYLLHNDLAPHFHK